MSPEEFYRTIADVPVPSTDPIDVWMETEVLGWLKRIKGSGCPAPWFVVDRVTTRNISKSIDYDIRFLHDYIKSQGFSISPYNIDDAAFAIYGYMNV